MKTNIFLFGSFLAMFLFTFPLNQGNTFAPKIIEKRLVPNFEQKLPPPVQNAFNDLLEQSAQERGFSHSQITNSRVTWSKEKNEYNITGTYIFGICQEGGIMIRINATFTANGELVDYDVFDVLCTGLIEF